MRPEAEIRRELLALDRIENDPAHQEAHRRLGIPRCDLEETIQLLDWVLGAPLISEPPRSVVRS